MFRGTLKGTELPRFFHVYPVQVFSVSAQYNVTISRCPLQRFSPVALFSTLISPSLSFSKVVFSAFPCWRLQPQKRDTIRELFLHGIADAEDSRRSVFQQHQMRNNLMRN